MMLFLRRWPLWLLLCLSSLGARALEGQGAIFHLEEYKPIYFVYGRPDTKIEFSFKIKLLESANVYFGYTQLMLWELLPASPYFKDINYNPEFFYRMFLNQERVQWLDFSPFEHESNGLGGTLERSWNRAYVRYHDGFEFSEKKKLFYSVSLWTGYDDNPQNRDIMEYRGTLELEGTLTNLLGSDYDRSDLSLRLYPGGPSTVDPLRGGQELLFQVKTKRLYLPEFLLEVFHGYGENLLNYKDNRFAVRFGVGF